MDNTSLQQIKNEIEKISTDYDPAKWEELSQSEQDQYYEMADKIETAKSQLLQLANELSASSNEENFSPVYITANVLHVRENSSAVSPIIGKLTKGEEVMPTSESNGWYKIIYQGGNGWISGKYTRKTNDAVSNEDTVDFKIDKPYNSASQETILLREIINDEFGGGRNNWDLQCTEYVHYKVKCSGHKINWPVKSGRNGGQWAQVFRSHNLYNVSSAPTKGAAMSFTSLSGYGHVAYIEEVFEDGSVKISEANWPKSGIYQERKINKDLQKQYGAMFVRFI